MTGMIPRNLFHAAGVILLGMAVSLPQIPSRAGEDVRSRACAHRGDVKQAPENTIPAFQLAVRKGAHQIEFDVRSTSDGRLVLMHDPTVDRTTDGSGEVTEMSFDEIASLDAGGWYAPEYRGTRVPTLEQALEVIPPYILCNCHIKGSPQVAEKAARIIERMGRLDQCFLAATVEQAEAAGRAVPEIRICNMTRQAGADSSYPEETIRMGCAFIQLLGSKEGLKETVDRLHRAGVTVNFFHGSDEASIRKLIRAGVDYILTDDLDLCLKILSEYGVQPARP